MTEPAGRLAWIAIAPVKSMARVFVERAELGLGIPGDRVFAVVDQRGQLVNGKRAGHLATVAVEHDPTAGTLTMRFPDGTVVGGRPGVGEPAVVALAFVGCPLGAKVGAVGDGQG
jgi:uncharacterized protein YcbX